MVDGWLIFRTFLLELVDKVYHLHYVAFKAVLVGKRDSKVWQCHSKHLLMLHWQSHKHTQLQGNLRNVIHVAIAEHKWYLVITLVQFFLFKDKENPGRTLPLRIIEVLSMEKNSKMAPLVPKNSGLLNNKKYIQGIQRQVSGLSS